MPQVTATEVFESIREACVDHDVGLPPEFEDDFNKHLGDIDVAHFKNIRLGLCKKIQNVLKGDKEMDERYGEIYSEIADRVKFYVAMLLGFEEFVEKPFQDSPLTMREALHEFLRSLPEGETWNPRQLTKWKYRGKPLGQRFQTRINETVGLGFGPVVIHTILGPSADEALKRNPFKRQTKILNTKYDVRRYLKSYLVTLPPGKPLVMHSLRQWVAPDGLRGDEIKKWIEHHHDQGKISELTIHKVLGEQAGRLLERNPYQKNPHVKIDSVEAAGGYLIQALDSLPEGQEWSATTLNDMDQIGQNGPSGKTLYNWISQNYLDRRNSIDALIIAEILGPDAVVVLKRNPFQRERVSQKIRSVDDVRKNLLKFTEQLPAGQTWSPKTLYDFGLLEKDGALGRQLYYWLMMNVQKDDQIDWLFVLVKMILPEYLVRNPFRHRTLGAVSAKKIPPRKGSTTTSGHDIAAKAPRGIPSDDVFIGSPEFAVDPEQLYIEAEEAKDFEAEQAILAKFMKEKFSPAERAVVKAFQAGKDVDTNALEAIVTKLRNYKK